MATTTPNRGYQLPAAGNKLKDDVLRIIAALGAIDADMAATLLALADKSDVGHGHGMDAITGLVAALGNKLDVGYHDALANLTDVDVAGVANGMALLRQASKWIPVALQINNIAGLEVALNGKATPADITAAINALVAAAPGALDTLNELAAALGNDANFAATMSSALALRVRADAAQAFSGAQKTQARTNIGADDAANLTTGTLPTARLPADAYKRSNILAALSHTSGVPTGGIMQRGDNANGAWVMFANGTLICSRVGITFSKPAGPTWVSAPLNWPMSFGAGTVHAVAAVGAPTSNQLIMPAVHADLATYQLYMNSTDALVSQPLSVLGIGRWF